jgi:hypothetical protein
METYGDPGIETVKYMFGFCQYSGGLYYGVPNDLETGGDLKARAAVAKGLAGDSELMTLGGFWQKYFTS